MHIADKWVRKNYKMWRNSGGKMFEKVGFFQFSKITFFRKKKQSPVTFLSNFTIFSFLIIVNLKKSQNFAVQRGIIVFQAVVRRRVRGAGGFWLEQWRYHRLADDVWRCPRTLEGGR